ncbi:MAG: hypothetical protein CMA70_00115 [Euryarchaeota archaeon]|nr:hypothetical protein [Euryarchaeota archaeon]
MPAHDTAVTCPDCGSEFDIADRLRSHIESEVRAELRDSIRSEIEEQYESKLALQQSDLKQEKTELEDKVKEQRDALKSLRKSKLELDDMKENQKIALAEAKAQALREAKTQMNDEFDEKVNRKLKEETADKDLRIGKLELQLERQNSKIKELEEQSNSTHGELEGEVLELAVEAILRNLFPRDGINEVKRGAYGADVEHAVPSSSGSTAGKIIWECKKHKRWNEGWVPIIRKNAIEYGADTMVIVTTKMPDGMENFGVVDDVFVCRYHEVAVVAELLRHAILRASDERVREKHMMSIQERVLAYVSGPEFAMVMRGIMSAYEDFEDDLRKEEQYMKRRWSARRGYLRSIIDSVTSMMGRLDHLGAGDFEVMHEIEDDRPSEFLVMGVVEEEE